MKELIETVPLMTSSDYKKRFASEYYQLETRLFKLQTMCKQWDSGELDFTPTCPRSCYDLQIRAMIDYKAILEMRAKMENIDLYLLQYANSN